MLGAVLAPWVAAGVLASLLVVVGFVIVLGVAMWADWAFARFVLWVVAAIVLVTRWMSG